MVSLVELSDQCSDIQKRTAPKQAKLRVFTQSGWFLERLISVWKTVRGAQERAIQGRMVLRLDLFIVVT
jgi:hypothetical protein